MNIHFLKTAVTVSAVSLILTAGIVTAQPEAAAADTYSIQTLTTQKKNIQAPAVTSLSSTVNGLSVKWNKAEGAAAYNVYRKTKNTSEKLIAKVNSTSYTDPNAASGNTYTYFVRCVDQEGSIISTQGKSKSIKYIKTPVITKISNNAQGSKITWTKVKGASKYKVYYLSKKKWKRLATVKGNSYNHKKLTGGKTYTYRVRAVNSKGKFVGGYDYKGTENIFVKPPVITAAFNNADSVSVKWKKVKGAYAYNVYRKTGDGKSIKLDCVKTNSFVDKTVSSGKKYTYTVRCVNADGAFLSSASESKSVKFVKAPEITGFMNLSDGTKLEWTKTSGASKYAVYYLNSKKKWKKLATVSENTYIHTGLSGGTEYTYRVRALNKNGESVSSVRKEKSNIFVSPVKLSQISLTEQGTLVKWNTVKTADNYHLFRKEGEGNWTKIYGGDDLSFTDTTAKKDTLYRYGLRCVDGEGNYVSYIYTDAPFYYNGELADGEYKLGNKTYKFIKGYYRRGIQVIDGKTYYYNDEGVLEKDGIVGSSKDGWYYADKNGVINMNYVNGVKENGTLWIIINGKARKAVTKSDKTLYRAAKVVAKATKTTMTPSQKLRTCFNYVKKAYIELNPRIPHYNKKDWPVLYANDMFVDGAGNCFSYAAAFAYMARAIGYTEVYCCHSGGHGWVEIDGRLYDPEWSRHHDDKTYYALSYSQLPYYKAAIKKNVSWMYVKIK